MSPNQRLLLAGALLVAGGTVACDVDVSRNRVPTDKAGADQPAIQLFADQAGTGRISIAWSDRRKDERTVQAFADADSFSSVVFTLSNAARFRQARARAFLVQTTPGNTQLDAFSGLPSDPNPNYVLSAILFRNVATDSLSVPAYAERDNVVGVGLSAAFSLAPGENRRVPILIHAVPPLAVDTDSNYKVNRLVPTLVENDPHAYAEMILRELDNPLADRIRIRFLENGSTNLLGTREYLKSATTSASTTHGQSSPSGSAFDAYASQQVLLGDTIQSDRASDSARLGLTLPGVPAGRTTLSTYMQVEMASGDLLLSRRGMGVIIERGGQVGVSLDATSSAASTSQATSSQTTQPI